MDFFKTFEPAFDLAFWENQIPHIQSLHDLQLVDPGIEVLTFGDNQRNTTGFDAKQFVIFQISSAKDKRILATSEVVPVLKGSSTHPDINLWIDIDSFKISEEEGIDPNTKVTLQLVLGQDEPVDRLAKLFYCINGGLDLFDQSNHKYAKATDFKTTSADAFGHKPVSLPKGVGTISLKVVKHQSPPWWKSVFDIAGTHQAKKLISLIGFGGITDAALQTVGGMMDMLFKEEPEVLFRSSMLKAAFSKEGKKHISGNLETNYVSSLNPGYWLMAKIMDYHEIKKMNPIYFSGCGMLAPDGFSEIDAQNEQENPFFNKTYAVLRVQMKEVNLKQNFL